MTRFNSQTTVRGGYYFQTSTLSLHAVEGQWGKLPGEPGTLWVRLPLPLMIVAAAVLSLGFVVFLPVIGFALLFRAAARPAARALARAFPRLAHTLGRALPPVSPRA
jgi:hypothetical protein